MADRFALASEAGLPERPHAPSWRRHVYSFIAPCLVLVTPFLVFLNYHRYAYARGDTIVCLLVLATIGVALGALAKCRPWTDALMLAAAIVILVDVQSDSLTSTALLGIGLTAAVILWAIRRHAAQIVSATAATLAFSSMVMPGSVTTAPAPAQHGNPRLPLILHVILDEHIGVEGLPDSTEMQQLGTELRSFFAERGFRLFGGAYSEYFNSNRSISHLLNFATRQYDPTLFEEGTNGFNWNLKRNHYFDQLANRGYALHIYQPDYLQMCPNRVARCNTYSSSGIGVVQETELALRDRVRLIASIYLDRSVLYGELRDFYRRGRNKLARSGLALPSWNWERDRIGAIASAASMERLRRDIASAGRGDFVFAHLLLPHSPYLFDDECRLLPLDSWQQRDLFDAPPQRSNTPDSRRVRYHAYARQVRCAYRKLGEILESIPSELARDAVIMIHGDHGSRITLVEPLPGRVALMQASDYADSYSTLFAIRSPGFDAGYDSRQVAIACLLRTLFVNNYESTTGLDDCAERPSVLLVAAGRAHVRPLPPFDSTLP